MRWRFTLTALACLTLLLGTPARAAVDQAELAFWRSIQARGNPAEYQAYLDVYPNGAFAALARIRLNTLLAAPAPPAAQPTTQAVSLKIAGRRYRVIDSIPVDVDATPLRLSSNLRLAVVPSETPDAIADPAAFVAGSTSITPSRLHLYLTGGPPGRDEVRLYHVPRFGRAFEVAARAAIEVQPGAPGAVVSRDLVQEARNLGPLRFEAAHRDRPILVQGQFLRSRPGSDTDMRWLPQLGLVNIEQQAVIVSIGERGTDSGEMVCLLRVPTPADLDAVAALKPGDSVLARGTPTAWGTGDHVDSILMRGCTLAHP